jgi:predicted nucleotidyltransferase
MKAAKQFGAELSFETVCRRGAGYLSRDIEEGVFQSATAIREKVFTAALEKIESYLPSESLDILKRAKESGDIADISKLEKSLRLFFRMASMKELSEIADVDEGLASRICRAAREDMSGDIIDYARTKRYTDSRIRRAILFSLVGVKREDIAALPEYVNLLAANSVGCKLLASKRGKTPFALLSKAADIPQSVLARRQAELSERLDAIFTLALDKERAVADILKKSPVIL